ncbi:MAG: helix-turn-helix domain-containing protein, partial [Candidatus Dormibacteraceae bacterium]
MGNDLLRAARLAAGLSQAQLAAAANASMLGTPGALDANTIARYESGRIDRPSWRNSAALAKVLGTTPVELGFRPTMNPAVAATTLPPATMNGISAMDEILGGLRRLEDA